MFRILKILPALILICNIADSQFFEYGQDPASLKWRQMDTEHFRLIYPEDFSGKAQNLAGTLEKYYGPNSEQLNHYPSKTHVIIHNQSVISNAFVALAPRRMEFFTYPDPNYFGQDWLTELVLHEFRHAIQVDKLDKGFTRILSRVSGEQGIGLAAAMLPFWFLEGDAVSAETNLSNTGRGRLPSFEMEIKAHILSSGKFFSFSKSYLGSYKHFVPDHYRYGYQIVSYIQQKYGENYWANAIDFVAKNPFTLFPLHHYTKRETGKGLNGLYYNTMDHLKAHWKNTLSDRVTEDIPALNKREKEIYTSYIQPKFINDSTIISYKTGLNLVPRFVKIDLDGKEEKIILPGILNSGKISVSGSKIIWDENAFDNRWSNRNYSVLKEYDMNTGLRRKLTSRTRYAAPEYSISGDTIAVIEATPQYMSYLVLLSAKDGKVLDRISSPDHTWLQYPVWRNDKYGIIAIAVNENGKRIISYDLNEKSWSEIYNAGYINISQLNINGNFLYFNASFDGIDNIYSLNLQDSILSKLSRSKFGAFYPEISGNNSLMVYSDYSNKGYDLKIKRISPGKFDKFSFPEKIKEQSFISVDTRSDIFDTSPGIHKATAVYPENHYSKIGHLFKIHSWSPFYFNYNEPEIVKPLVSPGITILSQNHLGTAISSLAYEYKDKTNYLHSSFTYKGFFPVFELSAVYGGIPHLSAEPNTDLPVLQTNLRYRLLTYIPLKLNTGAFYTGLQPSVRFTYNSSYFFYTPPDAYKRGLIFFEPGLYMYSYKNTSRMDLQPDLGITVNMKSISSPFEDQLFGSNSSLEVAIYLPGLMKNHGLKFKGEWQKQNPDRYIFSNHLNFPRGYAQMSAISLSKFSGDYVLPLLYPDLSIGPLIYIKRLRTNLFMDYLIGNDIYDNSGEETRIISRKEFFSEGVELYLDYHLFRFIFEFSNGIRFSYLPFDKKLNYELLFTVNLYKF